MRRLGLIGGMSWESTAIYYRLINTAVRDRLGPLRSADLVLHSVDFGPIEQLMRDARWDQVGVVLAESARRLEHAGAGAIVLCTNTMHKLAGAIESATRLPLLHIVDATATAARRIGARRLGLLATGYTMEQAFLRQRYADRFGIEVLVPAADQRREVHRIIFEELCAGVIAPASRDYYRAVIDELRRRGADAVVLGCTEIGLLIGAADSALPLLDSAELHALAAVDFALADEPGAGA
jgi:aspartate racemase